MKRLPGHVLYAPPYEFAFLFLNRLGLVGLGNMLCVGLFLEFPWWLLALLSVALLSMFRYERRAWEDRAWRKAAFSSGLACQALVLEKHSSSWTGGAHDLSPLARAWCGSETIRLRYNVKDMQIEEDFRVSSDIFTRAKPGSSMEIRVLESAPRKWVTAA